MVRRRERVREPKVETKEMTPHERRKAIIDKYYTRCRICGFFMERKFPGDDVCDAPSHKINEDEIV